MKRIKQLSPSRIKLLELLICYEPIILQCTLKDNSVAEAVDIKEDGSILIYSRKRFKFWQRFLGDYSKVSLLDLAVNVSDAITGSGDKKNDLAFEEMTRAILNEACKSKDYDCIVDILLDVFRSGTDGVLASKYITNKDLRSFVQKEREKYCALRGTASIGSDIPLFATIRLNGGATVKVQVGHTV